MDFEQRMRTVLRDGAHSLRLPEAGPEAARERAGRRTRRRRAVSGGLTALVLLVAGIGGWRLLPEQDARVRLGGPASGGAASAFPDLEWRDAEGVVGHRAQGVLHSADGFYYALSTAPGSRVDDHPDGVIPQALYRSADGLSWEAAELGADPWIADLGEREGVLYAVSTAPSTSGTGSGRTAVSTDGGQTWSEADLPSKAAAPEADVAVEGPFVRAQLAIGDSAMLAWTNSMYRIPDREVFPAAELGERRYVRASADGMELVEASCHGDPDPGAARPEDPCDRVIETVAWSELGLSGHADLRVDELFRSTDGESWEALDASAFADRYVQALSAGPHGFFAITHAGYTLGEPAGVELLRSADGTTWEEVGSSGPVATLGFAGERIIGTTGHGDRSVEAVSSADGGATWTRTDLAEIVDPDGAFTDLHLQAQATGPLGAAVVTVAYPDEGHPGSAVRHLLTSVDGTSWAVTPLEEIVGDDTPSMVPWVAVGRDSIVLTAGWLRSGEQPASTRTFVGTPVR